MLVAVLHFPAMHHAYGSAVLNNLYLFVDFFFVLSGFVIAHSYRERLKSKTDVERFLVRRFGRVWPLHVAMIAAFALVEVAKWVLVAGAGLQANTAPFDPSGQAPLAALPANIFLAHGLGVLPRLSWDHPSWSISAEFWSYVLFALIFLVCAARWRLGAIAVLMAVAAVELIAHATHGMDATYDWGFARCVIGFGAGVIVEDLRRTIPAPTQASTARLEWPAVLMMFVYIGMAGTGPLSFAAPLVFAFVVYVFSFEAGPVSQLLRRGPVQALGRWSYSIYMVHALLVTVFLLAASAVQKPLGRELVDLLPGGARVVGHIDPAILDLALFGYLIAVVVAARFTYRMIETPGRTFFNGLAERVVAQNPDRRQAA